MAKKSTKFGFSSFLIILINFEGIYRDKVVKYIEQWFSTYVERL